LIVLVLALKVRPVVVVKFHAVPLKEQVMFEAPSVSVRVLELLDDNDPHDSVCPLVFRVPVVRVTAPTTVVPELSSSVMSDLFIVMVLALAATSIVTVAAAPELESKVTSSEEVGTAAPELPPEVVDQWAVLLQLPVPEIQNLAAIQGLLLIG
jgi:hypothetical protein